MWAKRYFRTVWRNTNVSAQIGMKGRESCVRAPLFRFTERFAIILKACLLPALQTTIANTGVVPDMVSVDDGYASKANLEQTKNLGVKIINISGAKGKRLLGEKWEQEEYQEARKSRSAVESLMFCLKYSYRFGQLSRTGLEAVRQELMEKTLAYNIARLVYLRNRKHQFLRKSAA